MKIDIITIFPNFFEQFLTTSIIKRAIDKNKVTFNIIDLRDYAYNKHRAVDDTPYGGGVGMLMTFPPFYECLKKIRTNDTYVIYVSPQGTVLNQEIATSLAETKKHIVIICGHYEGIDQRVLDFIDAEISIGDYVLTGGEIPAMVLSDAIIRLIPDVITKESYLEDSHQNGLLKYPQYTKPETYEGYSVPNILLSGHHENIRKWRLEQSLIKTYNKRPDLLEKKQMNKEEIQIFKKINRS